VQYQVRRCSVLPFPCPVYLPRADLCHRQRHHL